MQFNERLEQLRKEKGVTQKAVLEAVGASHNQYQNWVKGNMPLPSTLEKLASYFNVSVNYLKGEEEKEAAMERAQTEFIEYLDDHGYSFESTDQEIIIGKDGQYLYYDPLAFSGLCLSLQNRGKPEIAMKEWEIIAFPSRKVMSAIFETRPTGKQTELPVYGDVSAGFGIIAHQNIIGWEVADEKYDSDEYFFLRVDGDSMSPLINDGDYVLVHSQDTIENDQLAVCVVDGEGFVKKIELAEDHVTLISMNPYYPPRKFVEYDMNRVHILGRVIEMKRKF